MVPLCGEFRCHGALIINACRDEIDASGATERETDAHSTERETNAHEPSLFQGGRLTCAIKRETNAHSPSKFSNTFGNMLIASAVTVEG